MSSFRALRWTALLASALLAGGALAVVAGSAGAASTTFSYAGQAVEVDHGHVVPGIGLAPGFGQLSVPVQGLTGPIEKVTVTLGSSGGTRADCGIRQSDDRYLRLTLTSPARSTVELVTNRGGYNRDFCGTVFDDAAEKPISHGAAPFSGTYRPESPLSAFAGESADGTWTLSAYNTDYAGKALLQHLSITFTTTSAASITGAATATGKVGEAFWYAPTVAGDPAPVVSVSGGSLPPGLSLDSGTGVVSGTPTGDGGVYPVTLSAGNEVGVAATLDVSITINKAPTITASDQSATAGTAFSFTPSVTGLPTPTVHLTGGSTLPTGLSINPASGEISGTPVLGSDGVYTVKLKAHNVAGNKTTSFVLTVDKPPVTGLAPSVTGLAQVGQTLTAHAGPVVPADSTLSYVWKADGQVIAGETGPTLVLTRAEVGKHVRVRIRATHVNYAAQAKTSARTPYVRQLVAHPRLRLVGAARQGEVATFLAQGLTPGSSATFAYAYLRHGQVTRVADEYGEIHLRVRIPFTAPLGPSVITMVASDPVDVEPLMFRIHRDLR